MPKYIEQSSLLQKAKSLQNKLFAVPLIIDAIEYAPTVDAVEVVWCRDCKHRYVPCDCALWYGTYNGNEYFIERGDDFYCSFGEKKEGAEK